MLTPDLTLDALNSALLNLTRAHARQMRQQKLVLYAGASLADQAQRDMMSDELSSMPFMGPLDDKEQPGAHIVAELERFAADIACRTFHADWADMRLPSCTIANLAVFSFFGGHGQLMLGPAASDGGHLSQRRGGTPTIVGMEVKDLPFDHTRQMLDEAAAAEQIERLKPKMLLLGRSVILKPDSIDRVVAAARRCGTLVVYDASHVLGLIAGGVFPNPLDAGVDVLTSSTYKTLRGPPGGIVMGRDKMQGLAFSQFLDRQMLANQNASRFPAMISAIRSCHADTGYAQRVIDTAQAFKKRFLDRALNVLLPEEVAASHQVVVDTGSLEMTKLAMRNLETSGILVGLCSIPGFSGRYGLRFGSQVVASMDFSRPDLEQAADIIADTISVTMLEMRELFEHDSTARRASQFVEQLIARHKAVEKF